MDLFRIEFPKFFACVGIGHEVRRRRKHGKAHPLDDAVIAADVNDEFPFVKNASNTPL